MATLVLSSNTVAENAQQGGLVGILSVAGDIAAGETFTFTLNHDRFEIINGNQLVVKSGGFDFEGPQKLFEFDIQVVGTHNTVVEGSRVAIDVTNVNEAPTDILMTGGTIGDNAIIGATVATLAGQDPDRRDLLTYTIVENEAGTAEYDHPYFGILGNEIVVKHDLSDASVQPMSVYVKVTDTKGLSYVKQVTLTVTPVNEAPEVSAEPVEVLDGSKGGTIVAVVSAEDPEGSVLTYKLSAASAQWFDLVNNNDGTWNVVVKQGVTLRSDRAAFQSFVIEVSDSDNNTTTETVFLNINENLEPEATFEFVEVEKNTPAGTLVGTLVGYDPEGEAVGYKLVGESDDLFTLVKNANGTFSVFVKQGVTLDYTDDAQHGFTVTVTDGFKSFEESFEIVFRSYAPKVAYAPPISVKEGAGGNIVVASFKVTDSDSDYVDCMLSPESDALFDVVDRGNGNYDVVVRKGVSLDYENASHRVVKLIVSDEDNTLPMDLMVHLTDEVDVITGTTKADALAGTAGRDIIKGLAGSDSLVGNTGNDTLYGGAGKDVLNGGGGQDVFVFDSKPNKKTNLDKVADFSVADDSIWLENKIFAKLGKKGSETAPAQLKKSFFVIGDKAKDGDDYLIYSKKTGKLSFDVDGSGSKAAVEIATLSKKLAMTHKDFFVV
ncbi:Ig-like domain-containing protein [Microvirga sp. BSC39]|uniref:Ig-like domain-containing protein n=1 Tax=Microvirga sp. BSC39 TaxID=1549810 RepID=UPI00068F17D3|nr:Ig-like domain-containing protein [Microvirga sp. BSC39]